MNGKHKLKSELCVISVQEKITISIARWKQTEPSKALDTFSGVTNPRWVGYVVKTDRTVNVMNIDKATETW